MNEIIRQELEASGWKLARKDQPGIYVRVETTPANDIIDWTSEPTAMLRDLERIRSRRIRRQIKRRQLKKEVAVP
jgi:hypothetical protein